MNRILTKLGHNHLWVTGYKSYYISWPQVWPRGHRGQKRSNLRNVSTQTGNTGFWRNFSTWIVSTFSTKLAYRKKCPGSFGVTGGQIKGSILQLYPILKVEVSNCSYWPKDQKCPWWPLRPTFPSGVKGQRKVLYGLNFQL